MVNICYLFMYKPFEDSKILKLEVMNEVTNFILLYHVILFAGLVPESVDRYMVGWSFIVFISANMLVHFILLVKETLGTCKEDIKKRCSKKPKEEEEKIELKELTVIFEEEFESNFSSKSSRQVK